MQMESAIAWVHSLPRLAKTAGVDNTRQLLSYLGNPQNNLRFVHVAGTNGKGSVTVMLASVLAKAGYTVGANISPYVLDFRERFLLNGQMISPEELAQTLTEVKQAVQTLIKQGHTFVEFDIVTATALLWFSRKNCDIVCLETGLGGRLDSTNAVQNTLVACITCIGLDHTELLGDTFSQIAKEKCGIIKNNCDVVCYPNQPAETLQTIMQSANNHHFVLPSLQDFTFLPSEEFANHVLYKHLSLNIPFAGIHQAYNASMVVETAIALRSKGFVIEDTHIVQGIQQAKFPARIEIIRKNPLIILDGAHNADGAKALAQTLKEHHCDNLVAVIGVLQGKGAQAMLKNVAPLCQTIYTVTPNSPRALTAQELAHLAKMHCKNVIACDEVETAITLAMQNAQSGLLVCGSLYLAAQARKFLLSVTK